MVKKKKFYAYFFEGGDVGVFDNWNDCLKKVKGTSARYKSFKSRREAHEWISSGAVYSVKSEKKVVSKVLKDGIYFDAGTGRGKGVEVKVTDKNGVSLLSGVLKNDKITVFDTYFLGKKFTNNFGELTGLFFSLTLALKSGEKRIFGDSRLVLDYWSVGRYKKDLPVYTQELIRKVVALRFDFEKVGGKLEFVSGDINPADLGFHK